ncbi:MAG: tetratricopeptide repeat protein [Segetibacter sp.]|jgi:tetratricopeptide (TPR) repeat protein|nr:tetratricopeptide repeat protein [Segetibacter sp.]
MVQKGLALLLIVSFPVLAMCSVTNPDSAAFYLRIAVQQKGIKKLFEADKNFKKAIDFNPGDNYARIEYGNFLIDQRKYFVAYDQFSKVLLTDKNNAEALQKILFTSFLLNKWTDVIKYGTQVTNTNSIPRLKYMIGKAYFEEEDYGLSQRFLKEAITDPQFDADAVILLGKVYIELSNYSEALTLFNKALDRDINNNKLIYQVGLLYYTINKEKDAVKYFQLAEEKGYKVDLDFKENLGMAYLGFDIDKGVEILNMVLEKKPNDAEIVLQIAQAHYKAKNFQRAADTFYKIYQQDPTNSRALYMTGMAYQKKGDKVFGTSLCEKAIKMDPTLGELKMLKYSF